IPEIAGAIARPNVHAAAERDGEVGEVAAHPSPFFERVKGCPRHARVLIAERDLLMHESQIACTSASPLGKVPNLALWANPRDLHDEVEIVHELRTLRSSVSALPATPSAAGACARPAR